MIQTAYDSLSDDEKGLVKAAFEMILSVGVLQTQMRLELEYLSNGNTRESEDSLLKRIQEFRQRRTCLMILEEFGTSIQEEK